MIRVLYCFFGLGLAWAYTMADTGNICPDVPS